MVFMNCRAIFNEIYRAYLGALIKTEGSRWAGWAWSFVIGTATSNNKNNKPGKAKSRPRGRGREEGYFRNRLLHANLNQMNWHIFHFVAPQKLIFWRAGQVGGRGSQMSRGWTLNLNVNREEPEPEGPEYPGEYMGRTKGRQCGKVT